MPLASMTSAPDCAASLAVMAALPAGPRWVRRASRKACKRAEPLDVALAPPGHAVAQPVLLGDDLAVELVLVALLFGEHLVAPVLEIGEAALDPARLAAIEPDRAARQVGQKPPVVADHHQRGAAAVELALQPFDGGEVEMVGRLVEQQDVRLRRQHARQRGAARLAAGQVGRVFAAVEAELLQQLAGLMRAVVRAEAGFDIGQRGRSVAEIRLLRADSAATRRAARTPSRGRARRRRPRS